MRRVTIVTGLLLLVIHAYAQQQELDSLLQVLRLHTKQDTTRIDILNDIAYAYHTIDPDKGLVRADEAIALSKKINDPSRIASSHSNKGANYWAKGQDSLAMEMYHIALDIHKAAGNKSRMARIFNNVGLLYFNKSDYYSAAEYHEKALNIFTELNDSARIAAILNNLGVDYQYISNYPKALDCYFTAVVLYEKIKGDSDDYRTGIANAYSNIGVVYRNMGKDSMALEYLEKSLTVFERMNNRRGMASVYGSMGVLYDQLSKPRKAIEFHLKAFQINEASGNMHRAATDLTNLGGVYLQLKEYDKAFEYLQKARELYESAEDKNDLAVVLSQIGELYLNAPESFLKEQNISSTERYSLAMKYEKEALKLSKEVGAVEQQSLTAKAISEIHEARHEPAEALAAFKQHVTLKDSVLNDEKRIEITRKEAAFEFEKKQALMDAEHDKTVALAAAEIRRQRIIRNVVIGGILLVLCAAMAGYVLYKRKRDTEQRRKEVEFKARVTETEMKALRAQMNPHFIFNSLNSIADYITKNDIEAADIYLTKFAKLMRMILENSELKEVSLADDLKALELYMQLEAKRLNNKFTYEIKADDNIDAVNTLVPPLLLQPFVENSIWHGIANKQGNGKIIIHITRENEMIKCIVEDDGVGRNYAATNSNAEKEDRKSLGMKITNERITHLNKKDKPSGAVALYDLEQGLRAEVSFPLELAF
ncbi:MAG TPA: tetratricopeptide repeat protein [Agriterribacter sp.]|nr:tetratricopeptide repeat protein [Agriterribacter sp.]